MPLPWLIAIVVAVEIALGIAPKADRLTWALENLPVWIGLVLLAFTHQNFPLSRLCLNLFAIHAVILAVGGYYSYANVPLGEWVKEAFDLKRNHYDRLGHFVQGFVPAIFVRELLLRTSPLARGKWLAFLVVSVCLAFSAAFELFEWLVAEVSGDGAPAYLGRKATCGMRSGTCCWRGWAPARRCWFWAAGTTVRSPGWSGLGSVRQIDVEISLATEIRGSYIPRSF
jgi:putative membrane protein